MMLSSIVAQVHQNLIRDSLLQILAGSRRCGEHCYALISRPGSFTRAHVTTMCIDECKNVRIANDSRKRSWIGKPFRRSRSSATVATRQILSPRATTEGAACKPPRYEIMPTCNNFPHSRELYSYVECFAVGSQCCRKPQVINGLSATLNSQNAKFQTG